MFTMGAVASDFCILVVLVGSLVCPGVQGDNPANMYNCNCGQPSTTDDISDLQERVACLENAVEQLTNTTTQIIEDCSGIPNDGSGHGVFQLRPEGSDPFDAFCVFDDDGEWTVLQQRVNGNTDFNRAWVTYKRGFGTLAANSNFWLGLEKIHLITKQNQYTLRVDLTDWDDAVHYAEYSFFYIDDEASKYAITLKSHSGTLPDALISKSQGTPFTTFDQDNDKHNNNCAVTYVSAWWHVACYAGQLNGPYRTPPNNSQGDPRGITWKPLNNAWVSMKASRMRIKPTFED